MATARFTHYSDNWVAIDVSGLEYPARNYVQFRLYIDSVSCGTDSSGNSYNSCGLSFNVSHINDGWYQFRLEADFYNSKGNLATGYISGSNQIHIDRGGSSGGDPDPPTPTAHQMTQIKITDIDFASSNGFRISWKCNGYGEVRFQSNTRKQENSNYILHEVTVREYDLDNSGWYYSTDTIYTGGSVYRADLTIFGHLPLGTVQLIGEWNSNVGYAPSSRPFLCLSQYSYTNYTGRYPATVQYSSLYGGGYDWSDPRVAVASFGSLKDEWTTLVNVFYYLEATTRHSLEYGKYSNYIPASGDIITAYMYNSLMESAESCANAVGVWTSFPSRVESGQVIPSNFISRLGDIANACLEKQKSSSNSRAIEY